MANIDDRVVSMAWENQKFISGVSTTLSSLDKLNAALKKIGIDNGLDNIEKSANKVQLSGLGRAIDSIKSKFGRGVPEAAQAFSDIEKGSGKVTFGPLTSSIDKVKGQLNFDREAQSGFSQVEKAASNVDFGGLTKAAGTAFSQIETSAGKVHFQGLTEAIGGVNNGLNEMAIVGGAALGTLASKAAAAGVNFAKSISPFDGLKQGFGEYETQLNAVQTILSNTKASGAGLKDVNKSLNELNTYADKTIYNFSEMAKNIGTFTAAGVDLKTATGSIKGIANLAALSGSNSQQASTAMYQLSQAISSGRVSLQDWNSVVNAGMGGTVFQRALAQTAEKMGTLDKGAVSLKGKMKNVSIAGQSFRESIQAKPGQDSWLTSKVLTSTLKQLSGDMTDAQLKAEGFSAAQIKAIQKQAKMATDAATKVKTLSGLLDTTKEAIGSGWAKTWQIIFGDFGEAKKLFTGLSTVIGGFVQRQADARNAMLKQWKDLGGRKLLIEGLGNAFKAISKTLGVVKEAFREVFPKTTGNQLFNLTKKFNEFTKSLVPGKKRLEDIKTIFKAVFSVFSIAKQIIGGLVGVVVTLFKSFGSGGAQRDILGTVASVTSLITKFDEWLKEGNRLEDFFKKLGTVVVTPIALLKKLGSAISGLFGTTTTVSGSGGSSISEAFGDGKNLSPLTKALNLAHTAVDKLVSAFQSVKNTVGRILGDVGAEAKEFGSAVVDAIKNLDFKKVLAVVGTGAAASLFLALRAGLKKGFNFSIFQSLLGLDSGAGNAITESLDGLTGSLKAMQTNIKADTLMKIGAAVALLAVSLGILAAIPNDRLGPALLGITSAFGMLVGTLIVLEKYTSLKGVIGLPLATAALIGLSGALVLMSVAVAILSRLSWDEVARGIAGVGAMLALMAASAFIFGKTGPLLIRSAVAIGVFAVALTMLSVPIRIFAAMKWETIGKGLAGVAGSLVAVGLAMRAFPKNILANAVGIAILAFSLSTLAAAIKLFSSISLETMVKGLAGIAVTLVAIGLAMGRMPKGMPLIAAGLVLVSIALTGIAAVIAVLGHMKLETLVKGVAALGVTMVILAGGLQAMQKSLPGSAALLVATIALGKFVPVLQDLGDMDISTIVKGLLAVAGVFAILAIAGQAAPAIVASAAALALFGVGALAVGAGVYLLAKGFSLLANVGIKAVEVLGAALLKLITLIPPFLTGLAVGFAKGVEALVLMGPRIVAGLVKIGLQLTAGFLQLVPKMAEAGVALITAFARVLAGSAGPLVKAAIDIVFTLAGALLANIGKLIETGVKLTVAILKGLTNAAPQLVGAGVRLIAAVLGGIAKNLGRVVSKAGDIVVAIVKGMAGNLKKIVLAGGDIVVKLIQGISGNMRKVLNAGVDLVIKLMTSIGNNVGKLVKSGVSMVLKIMEGVGKQSVRLAAKGADIIIEFIHSIADTIREKQPDLMLAGLDVGLAIVEGTINGFAAGAKRLAQAAVDLVWDNIPKPIRKILEVFSPSRVMYEIGGHISQGLIDGFAAKGPELHKVVATMASNIKKPKRVDWKAVGKVMKDIGQYLSGEFRKGIAASELVRTLDSVFARAKATVAKEKAQIKRELESTKADISKINARADARKGEKKGKLTKDEQGEIKKLRSLRTAHEEAIRLLEKRKNLLLVNSKVMYFDTAHPGVAFEEKLNTVLRLKAHRLKDVNDALVVQNDLLTTGRADWKSYHDGIVSSMTALPDIKLVDDEGKPVTDQLTPFMAGLKEQLGATTEFESILGQLRDLKLDETTYKMITDMGTAAIPFAKQIIAGGQPAVDAINNLNSQIKAAAERLGTNSADYFYKAGIDIAAGLVKSLNIERKTLKKEMKGLADFLVEQIKERLKIRSPSRVFEKIGQYTVKGLAVGLQDTSLVKDAASGLGDDAVSSIQDRLRYISDAVSSEIDTSPTITPILDLTQVRSGVRKLGALNDMSLGLASGIDATVRPDDLSGEGGGMVQFVQNNNSPKALSEAEIYRQTNNQLSQAKELLRQ